MELNLFETEDPWYKMFVINLRSQYLNKQVYYKNETGAVEIGRITNIAHPPTGVDGIEIFIKFPNRTLQQHVSKIKADEFAVRGRIEWVGPVSKSTLVLSTKPIRPDKKPSFDRSPAVGSVQDLIAIMKGKTYEGKNIYAAIDKILGDKAWQGEVVKVPGFDPFAKWVSFRRDSGYSHGKLLYNNRMQVAVFEATTDAAGYYIIVPDNIANKVLGAVRNNATKIY